MLCVWFYLYNTVWYSYCSRVQAIPGHVAGSPDPQEWVGRSSAPLPQRQCQPGQDESAADRGDPDTSPEDSAAYATRADTARGRGEENASECYLGKIFGGGGKYFEK